MLRIIFLLAFLSGYPNNSVDVNTEVEEYALKAAFLYNFSKYIDWNEGDTKKDFMIGVFGQSPIMTPLKEIAKNKTVNGRKIVVVQYFNPGDIKYCNILFISKNTSYALSEILAKSNKKGILNVSEREGYAKKGVGINFIIVDNNLKFEANTKAMNAADLKVSSHLLNLAILVD